MKIGILAQKAEKNSTGINKVTLGIIEELLKLDKENKYAFLGKTNWLDLPLGYIPIVQNTDEMYDLSYTLMSHPLNIVHSHYRPFEIHEKISCAKVFTIHDLTPLMFSNGQGKAFEYFNNAIRKCAVEADTIIAVSNCTKQDIINYYHVPEEKIKVVYNGLYPSEIYSSTYEGESVQELERQRFLLSVCGIEARKNLSSTVKAFVLYKEKHPTDDIKLVITGSIRQFQVAKELLNNRSKYINDVIITGYVEDKQLIWLYKHALAFVYASIYEGFGIPILEAMALGKAVICSNTSSMPEVGGDAVAYCNPKEIESIEDAICCVLNNEKYKCDLEKKALVQATKFSYAKAAKETLEIYQLYR